MSLHLHCVVSIIVPLFKDKKEQEANHNTKQVPNYFHLLSLQIRKTPGKDAISNRIDEKDGHRQTEEEIKYQSKKPEVHTHGLDFSRSTGVFPVQSGR